MLCLKIIFPFKSSSQIEGQRAHKWWWSSPPGVWWSNRRHHTRNRKVWSLRAFPWNQHSLFHSRKNAKPSSMHYEPWKEIENSHQGRDGIGEMYIKTKMAETYMDFINEFQFYCTLWLDRRDWRRWAGFLKKLRHMWKVPQRGTVEGGEGTLGIESGMRVLRSLMSEWRSICSTNRWKQISELYFWKYTSEKECFCPWCWKSVWLLCYIYSPLFFFSER